MAAQRHGQILLEHQGHCGGRSQPCRRCVDSLAGREQPVGAELAEAPFQETLGFARTLVRSEEHTSELQSLMRISYAVFCLKPKSNMCFTIVNDYSLQHHIVSLYEN